VLFNYSVETVTGSIVNMQDIITCEGEGILIIIILVIEQKDMCWSNPRKSKDSEHSTGILTLIFISYMQLMII